MQLSKSERIKYLVDRLNQANEAYYARDREMMSNLEYDTLYDELAALENETGIVLANSPTVNVGYEAVEELPRARHAYAFSGKNKGPGRAAELAARQSCNYELEIGWTDDCFDI